MERFQAAESGDGCSVLVTGDAGIGKSRLLSELHKRLDPNACWYAAAQSLEYIQAPYHVFLEIARNLFAQRSGADGPLEAPFSRLLSGNSLSESAAGETHQRKLRAFEGFAESLRSLARVRPLIVAVEDVHWADVGSIELLQYLVSRLGGSRILLIVTCRVGDISGASASLTYLESLERLGVTRVHLPALSRAETRMLIRRMVHGHDSPGEEAIEQIEQLADGNPLYAQELLRSTLMRRTTAGITPPRIPASLAATVAERLNRLEPELRSIIVQASIIGRSFDSDLLGIVAQRPRTVVLEALRQARDLQLLVEDGFRTISYAFTHQLVREVIYQQLLAQETLPLHERIARHLENAADAPNRTAELAYHWAAAGNARKAVHYNTAAGDMAISVHAHGDVARFYRRALHFAARKDAERGDLCAKLALVLYMNGLTSEAKHWCEEAIREFEVLGNGQRVVRLLLRFAKLEFFEANVPASVTLADRALRSLGSDNANNCGALIEAFCEIARYSTMLGRSADGLAYLNRAEQLAHRHGTGLAAFFYDVRAMAHANMGLQARALSDFEQSTQMADRSGDVETTLRIWNNYGCYASWLGLADVSIDAYERTLALCEARGFLVRTAFSALGLACTMFRLGRLTQARALVQLALERGVTTPLNRLVLAEVGIPLAIMLCDEALLAEAEEESVLDRVTSMPSEWTGPVAGAFAALALHRGQLQKARDVLHAALVAVPAAERAWPMLVQIAGYGYASDTPLARALLDRAPTTRTTAAGAAYEQLFNAHASARDGLRDTSKSHAKASAALFGRLGWPVVQAQALELSGNLANAAKIYRDIGSVHDVERMSGALQRRSRGRSGSKLTAREHQIAALVAEGCSNKAIAKRLGISEHTVGHHLESIFNRLEISSRLQLVSAMNSNGTTKTSCGPTSPAS